MSLDRHAARRLKDIAAQFNRASMAVRIPFRDRLMYWSYYIGLARRGVMIHSETLDAQYEDGFFKRGYEKYLAKINARLARARPSGVLVDVPSFEHGELSLEEHRLLMSLNIPFVIRDGAKNLPVKKWSMEYIEEVAGDCPVNINCAPDIPSDDTSRPTKAHHYYEFTKGTVSEVAESIRNGGHYRFGVAEDVMHYNGARLREDLDLPHWEEVTGWSENQHHWWRSRWLIGRILGCQLLFQPKNTLSLWHAEPGDNFFVLAQGTKTWTFMHPYYTAALKPRVKSTTNYHGSNIDIRESDDVQRQRGFAGYLSAPKSRVVMHPGDILRIPNCYWHTVVTSPEQYTLGTSIRSNGPPKNLARGYVLLRMLDKQFHDMAKAWGTEGRINDQLISYPRKPRKPEAQPTLK